MKTNAGNDFVAASLGNSGVTTTPADYVALSTDATAPSATDTVLTGELSTSGLSRKKATYGHTAGTNTYTLTTTFTSADSTARVINKFGVFNAASSGVLVFESAVPSPPTIISGDQITVTESVSF